MTRFYRNLVIFSTLCFLSCAAYGGQQTTPAGNEAVQRAAADSWLERRLAIGREVYEQACASCHDDGVGGAPAIGDRDAWSERSPLWLAVLFEHSKAGYLDMPAKGAHLDLTDQAVDAASEYMLSVTFPEKPLD
jgi:cytochrome c5